MDRRRFARYQVRCRSSFSSRSVLGEGTVTDLSQQGCRIASEAAIQTGTELETRIQLSDEDPPIEVAVAEVRWSRLGQFGLRFLVIEPHTFDSLRQFLATLQTGPIG